ATAATAATAAPAVEDLTDANLSALKMETQYCVPRELHDLHVRKSLARGYPSLEISKPTEPRKEPIALVCSGPSLAQTWEEIKGFYKILTCSGAHNFLIERGIVPTWHAETDPRAHKACFVKPSHAAVEYLIASNCHPDLFDALEGRTVRLWHVMGH